MGSKCGKKGSRDTSYRKGGKKATRRRKSTREPQVGIGPAAVARAERELARNREAIERTPYGTPAGRTATYHLGKSPSSYRETR